MNDTPSSYDPVGTPPPTPPAGISHKLILHIVYGLYAIGFLTGGLGAIAAVILCYVKRGDMAGTVYVSHIDWVLRTFWWSLLWGVISAIFTLILIGWIGLFATLIWVLYRLVKGWLTLAEGRSINGQI